MSLEIGGLLPAGAQMATDEEESNALARRMIKVPAGASIG
jgi:hypothetical protein